MKSSRFGNCCFCFEYRFGMGLICAFTFVYGLICGLAILTGNPRLEAGGYAPEIGYWQACVGALGLLVAPVGLVGVYDQKATWVYGLNIYQVIKLTVAAVVFVWDMIYLRKCEGWATTREAQINYSAPLFIISKKGVCQMARLSYVVGFAVDFGCHLYWAMVSFGYHAKLKTNPGYSLRALVGESSDTHMQVQFQDPYGVDPTTYLGEPLKRPVETHGEHYGAVHSPEQDQSRQQGRPPQQSFPLQQGFPPF
eukprot:TRINITY_DN4852_c0_g1_i2.p1 TRINITY_DN4852_c0_g1~~TRINITY_DN4852_c0_g1_i2.p1  ORF type:complete len:252 (-),score=24.32 TRINITY_DN4852_c0_g1_i2:205-960(-)